MIHRLRVTVLFYVVLSLFRTESMAQDQSIKPDSLFEEGRRLFALSVEDKSQIQPAIDLFEEIIEANEDFHARALAYLGALYTIKAKHRFFPFDKLKWAKEGLSLLDDALFHAPDNIEVLFVHGTICHQLPGLFKRQDDAQRDFNKIIELLPANMHRYDEQFIAGVLDYLNEEIDLNKEDQTALNKINSTYSIAAGESE
jgi:tetratricopeptide (TPR) repeat protein